MGTGNGHSEGVNGVCFADDDHVLSWSKDRTARYWTLSDGSSVVLAGDFLRVFDQIQPRSQLRTFFELH